MPLFLSISSIRSIKINLITKFTHHINSNLI
nr:MAG TPA: hypothetical protein [Caudoviricetes sp.]